MSKIVKAETNDRIVLVDRVVTIWEVVGGLVVIACGLFFLWVGIFFDGSEYGGLLGWLDRESVSLNILIIGLFIAWWGVWLTFEMLDVFLYRESIIVDKMLRNVIIGRCDSIELTKFTKNINFADIGGIEIKLHILDGDDTGRTEVSLIMINGARVKIDEDYREEAEKVAKKICDITGKLMSYQEIHHSAVA